jgi:hypothetical protein
VHVAVDVVEFNPAIGGEGVGLMKFLGQRAAVVGSMRSQRKDEQGEYSSKNSSQPGGRLAMAVHDSLRWR